MNKLTLHRKQPAPTHGVRHRGAAGAFSASTNTPAVRTLVAATAVALLLLPQMRDAQAQVIGDIDVRSRLGENFFAAVPVQSDRTLDPNCIQVSRNPQAPEGADALNGTRVRINPTGAVESIIIETGGAVTSPVIGLRLQVGCVNPVVRDFVVLGEGVPLPIATAQPLRTTAPVAATASARAAQRTRTVRADAPQAATAPAPRVQPPAPGADALAKAPVVASHSLTPPPIASAGAPTPARPAASADQDAQQRIAELRARSDDQAAGLLSLEDRLTLLQKQAELLKAQLEQTLAIEDASARASAATPPSAAAQSPTGVGATSASAAPIIAAPSRPAPSARSIGDLMADWRVIGGGLGGFLLAALAYKLGRRKSVSRERTPAAVTVASGNAAARQSTAARATQPGSASAFDAQRTQEYQVPLPSSQSDRTAERAKLSQPMRAPDTAQWQVSPPTTATLPVPGTSEPASAMATQPGGMTRDFHITQQFQPSAERTVAISTPEEIVQQARTHYMDDGDTFRAIDLLEMAVSVRTDSTRPWQALFAIYRRENMQERFQRLALAYRQAFGQDSNWSSIQALGLSMDANNDLYSAAAGTEPVPADLLERWLGVPLDFTAHLLANEMHDQLMETNPGRAKKRKRAAGE
jgi:hypothetical protein